MHFIARIEGGALGQMASRLKDFEGSTSFAGLLNTAGAALRAGTVAAETKQTHLSGGALERAQKVIPAAAGSLSYTIWSRGGNVRLRYFNAREGGGGVTADPWGASTFYPRAFMTSGLAPNRAPAAKLNGQVYTPVGVKWYGSIQQQRSGLYIPTEMTRGATAASFESGAVAAMAFLQSRLAAVLG